MDIKSKLYATLNLLLAFICFAVPFLAFYWLPILVTKVLSLFSFGSKRVYYNIVLSWDMCANALLLGDEQIRVSDRIYYWAKKGCPVAYGMQIVVDGLFYPFQGPDHCKRSFYSNPICVSGSVIPRPLPLFKCEEAMYNAA